MQQCRPFFITLYITFGHSATTFKCCSLLEIMHFKITVCHPDQKEIEEFPKLLNAEEALTFFKRFPWQEKLNLLESMDHEDIHYQPSVRFTNNSGRSLEMTADSDLKPYGFSLWYESPVMVKVFFGLMGEKEKNQVIDKWNFNPATAQKHLETFLDGKYEEVEKIMQAK